MAIDSSPNYGRRIIPQILDSLAATEPERIVYSIATFPESGPKFQEISARALAQAVNKTAWWIKEQLYSLQGRGQNENENTASTLR